MQIIGARGPPRSPDILIAAVRGIPGGAQLLDARLVCGREHLAVAADHAERAMREGANVAKTLAVEFVLYAAGERQIADALAKMGVRDDTGEFALVLLGGGDPDESLRVLGLSRDDRVLESNRQKLRAFGITEAELASVSPDRAPDLVLERVALVDLIK